MYSTNLLRQERVGDIALRTVIWKMGLSCSKITRSVIKYRIVSRMENSRVEIGLRGFENKSNVFVTSLGLLLFRSKALRSVERFGICFQMGPTSRVSGQQLAMETRGQCSTMLISQIMILHLSVFERDP